MTHPIPQPRRIPFFGNITSIDRTAPTKSLLLLAQQYGEIYRLDLLGRQLVVVSSCDLLNELCDDKRFPKLVSGAVKEISALVHDGLFTADTGNKNWAIAHRLLMPIFGTGAIRDMFPAMEDIVSQLVTKWERFGPDHVIDPGKDYTKLTLDAIALASMSYRMNSFYTEDMVPFVAALTGALLECQLRATRPRIATAMMTGTQAQFEGDIKLMIDTALALVRKRRENPTDPDGPKDLLDRMLTVVDTKTGEKMSDESIVDNLITFLIAGHETTAAMLTFLTYELLKHPNVLLKLRAEIDDVLGDQPIAMNDISKMPYTVAVLREILRFHPPAAARFVHSLEPTTIGKGKYALTPDDHILINSISTNRDPAVWGDDADEFKPERMLDGGFEKVPPNSWQPFGFGLRACIGRAFAIQEAHMAVATIFQRFDLVMDDPSYQLREKQTVTLKPDGFYIRAYPRNRKARLYTTPSSTTLLHGNAKQKTKFAAPADVASSHPLYVLYGSNSGTSEGFAQRVASDAPVHGFRPSIGTLDSAAERIPSDGPVVIITASFEGEPADNAAYFVKWLNSLQGEPLSDLSYAVFGCGNRDWVQTYQRIPRLVDELLGKRGGQALLSRGEGDAGGSDIFNDFDNWEDSLFKKLTEEYHTKSSKSISSIEIREVAPGTERAATLRQTDAALGEVIANTILTAPGKPVKRHLEFELPPNQTYSAGDYLAILPVNPERDVKRVLSRFKLLGEQEITISSNIPTSLPIGKSIAISGLLSGYVELSQPATPRNLRDLVESSKSEAATQTLLKLSEMYAQEVLAKRISLLDILEANPDIQPTFVQYVEMLPPIRVRQYSISSSPLWNPQRVSLTISVVRAPALSGKDEDFMGVATTFLDGLKPGDRVQMAIRPSGAFHLPQDPSIPVVMIAAGSGVAPMRGFIQERALQREAGRDVGTMTLFFGCRSPDDDFLYSKTDLEEWSKLGILEVRPAFSRDTEKSEGCRYVQDRIWNDRAVVSKWFDQGASYYFCGAGKVALEVKTKLRNMIMESKGCTEEEATMSLERLTRTSRFATDIFD